MKKTAAHKETPASILTLLGKAAGKKEAEAKPVDWKEHSKLYKKHKTFGMMVGKRKGLKSDIAELEAKVKEIDNEIAQALDVCGLKSVLVDETPVTRVEPSVTATVDKDVLLTELVNQGVDVEILTKAVKAATKQSKRAGYIIIRDKKED
jgi:hypothetical protein